MPESPSLGKILVADDQPEVRDYVTKILEKNGFEVAHTQTAEETIERVRRDRDSIRMVILDLDFGPDKMDGMAALERIKSLLPDLPVVMLSGKGTIQIAVKAIKDHKAFDFIEKDTATEERLDACLERARHDWEVMAENRRLKVENATLKHKADYFESRIRNRYRMVGKADALRIVIEKAEKLASVPRSVLIRGERGVGKEIVAATIHYAGNRAKKPFVTVNCAAVTGTLIESELFGHEKGAFTGAESRRVGRFEMADGGTLFLDEIGNMASEFQDKILRVIEYQEFERIGGTETIKVDVRVIGATNANIEEMIEKGQFRADLFDRLTFDTVVVPPIRERREDIPVLIDHFTRNLEEKCPGIPTATFDKKVIDALVDYTWPGNVRQLKNTVERLIFAADGGEIGLDDLPPEVVDGEKEPVGFHEKVERLERDLISKGLRDSNGNQKKASEILGLTYDQFRHYYRKFGLSKKKD